MKILAHIYDEGGMIDRYEYYITMDNISELILSTEERKIFDNIIVDIKTSVQSNL